jgi:hypothetical protein
VAARPRVRPTASPGRTLRPVRPASTVLAAALLLVGCTATVDAPPDPGRPAAPSAPADPPPPPPAACLLDLDALGAATGLAWTADAATASDTRCVYDHDRPADAGTPDTGGPDAGALDFVAVDVVPLGATTPDAELAALAGVCEGAPTDVAAGAGAFVCRFQGGSVFSALVDGGTVVTVSASGVPAGTTADLLAEAFAAQLVAIGG